VPSAAVADEAVAAADPLVRLMALRVAEPLDSADQVRLAAPLLRDPVRAVRIASARVLAAASMHLSGADRTAFDAAAGELVASERYNADRPERRVALGVFQFDAGKPGDAEVTFRSAIDFAPDFVPAYVNLAELLRQTGSEEKAEAVLRQGLARVPGSADLHYALGLSLTRSHRAGEALDELKRAAALASANARFAYAYALALNGAGRADEAIRVLGSTLSSHPQDRDVLFALASFERDAGRLAAARKHAALLVRRFPHDEEARALYRSLIP